jgi:hypothetical protein
MTTPSMLWASASRDSKPYILALICLFDDDEGQALLESEGGEVVAHGTWTINRTHDDEGGATPTVIHAEFPDTCEIDGSLLDELLSEIVDVGGSWGLDGYAPSGRH